MATSELRIERILEYVLLELLRAHPDGLTLSRVYDLVETRLQMPASWQEQEPTGGSTFRTLKKLGLRWRDLDPDRLSELHIKTEPFWKHRLRFVGLALRTRGLMLRTSGATVGLWRLTASGMKAPLPADLSFAERGIVTQSSPVYDASGEQLDAHFRVEVLDGNLTVIYESRGGTRGTPKARNVDYGRGLVLILARLQASGARITNAVLDTKAVIRPLKIEGLSYPITIDDPDDLQQRLGTAQRNTGRAPNAKGSGNSTKRIRLFVTFGGPSPTGQSLQQELAWPRVQQIPAHDAPIGLSYRPANENVRIAASEPRMIDSTKVERGNRSHAQVGNSLAEFLTSHGMQPLRPNAQDPAFDIAWHQGDTLYVAEVKSLTAANEETQLRLGLGQVLRYRHLLQKRFPNTVAVIAVEREPRSTEWVDLCRQLQVRLVWPTIFARLTRELLELIPPV